MPRLRASGLRIAMKHLRSERSHSKHRSWRSIPASRPWSHVPDSKHYTWDHSRFHATGATPDPPAWSKNATAVPARPLEWTAPSRLFFLLPPKERRDFSLGKPSYLTKRRSKKPKASFTYLTIVLGIVLIYRRALSPQAFWLTN